MKTGKDREPKGKLSTGKPRPGETGRKGNGKAQSKVTGTGKEADERKQKEREKCGM